MGFLASSADGSDALQWSAESHPGVAAQATVTRAGRAGVVHVCRSICATTACDPSAEANNLHIYLRDGASGVGAILWSAVMRGVGNSSNIVNVSGLNIPGTPGNAMTLEFDAAPSANHEEAVSMTGVDIAVHG